MNLRLLMLAMAAGLTALPAMAHADLSVRVATYLCERGAVVPVTYIDVDGQPALAVAMIEGRQIPMSHRVLTAGPRYIADNEQESYRWTIDGESAAMTFLEADDTAVEQVLLSSCKLQDPVTSE